MQHITEIEFQVTKQNGDVDFVTIYDLPQKVAFGFARKKYPNCFIQIFRPLTNCAKGVVLDNINTMEKFYTMQDLPLWSMWHNGESIGRLQIKMLLIKKGIDGGLHTIKKWREIFAAIGIVFVNPAKKQPVKEPVNSIHTLFDFMIDVSINGI